MKDKGSMSGRGSALRINMVVLQAHATKSKQDLTAREYFSEPVPVEEIVIKQNKSAIGKTFKAKAKDVQLALDALMHHEQDALRLKVTIQAQSNQVPFCKRPDGSPPDSGLGSILGCFTFSCHLGSRRNNLASSRKSSRRPSSRFSLPCQQKMG